MERWISRIGWRGRIGRIGWRGRISRIGWRGRIGRRGWRGRISRIGQIKQRLGSEHRNRVLPIFLSHSPSIYLVEWFSKVRLRIFYVMLRIILLYLR